MKKIFLFLTLIIFLNAQEINQKTSTSKEEILKFYIDDKIYQSQSELIKLILNTDSMDDKERQYWFDIMPSMNEQQTQRLFNILETERKKLEELEIKYQDEIKFLNEKHLQEWAEFQKKKSIQELKNDDSIFFIIKNESDDKENRPYILLPKSKIGNKEYIEKDFDKLFMIKNYNSTYILDITETIKNKSIVNTFSSFALSVEVSFNEYYKIYDSDIFQILDIYYYNLSYLKELKSLHLENIKKLRPFIKKEDTNLYEELYENARYYYYTNLGYEDINDTLKYLINYNGNVNDIFYNLHFALYSPINNEIATEFIKKYFNKIKEQDYKYIEDYQEKLSKDKIRKIEAQVLILSLVLEKYKNILDENVILKNKDFINKILLKEDFYKDPHYYEMTKLFIENKNEWKIKINSLKKEYEKDKNNNEIQAQLLEYLSYDALLKEIQGEDYSNELTYLEKISTHIFSNPKADRYIEIKFLKYLKLLNEKTDSIKKTADELKKLRLINGALATENKVLLNEKFNEIMVYMFGFFGTLLTIAGIIYYFFRKLLLKNKKVCNTVEFLLLFEYKTISRITEKILIYKLNKWLNKKLNNKIGNSKLICDIDYSNIGHKHCYDYSTESEKYIFAQKVSKYFKLLPINLHTNLDLRIGCLEELLFHKGYTKYLFIVESRNFNNDNELNLFIHNLAEKYVDAKIIIFNQKNNKENQWKK